MEADVTPGGNDLVLAEQSDGLRWLTLNRADKANAMTVGMIERITALIVDAADDPDTSAVVITGRGERIFCAGVDVREKPSDGDMARQRERRSHASAALQDAVLGSPKPVVVALNGAAIGGGAMLALLADACVACDSATLSLPEIDIGIATFSGASIVEAIAGRALAADLVQTARRMSAAEAATHGLVRAIVGAADLRAAAATAGKLLGGKDRQAFVENKRWLNRGVKSALAEAREEHARHRAAAAA